MIWLARSDEENAVLANPVSIDTHIRLASMRQIHCAIEHLKQRDFECSITLAHAGEGMLPEPEKPYLRHKIKDMSKSKEIQAAGGQTDPNDISVWLKHGTLNKARVETLTIPAEESVAFVCRAISKFEAVYNDLSPEMTSFRKWIKEWLENDLRASLNKKWRGLGLPGMAEFDADAYWKDARRAAKSS
jgi:hypothetical protein